MPRRSWCDPILARIVKAHAHRHFRQFEKSAARAHQVQSRLLQKLLAKNRTSEFGRAHGFAHINGYADFARQVPVCTYDDLHPYISKVMDGNIGALFGSSVRVLMFAMTSGTTDRPKYIPVTEEFLRAYRRSWNAFGTKALIDHPDALVRPILQVVSAIDEQRTKTGIPCGAISGLLASKQSKLVRKYYVVPRSVGRLADPEDRYYAIVRLAIGHDVAWLVTANPATHLKLAQSAATKSDALIRDVRDGTVSIDASPKLLEDLSAGIKPDPALAERLQHLADKNGCLYPKHFWNLSFIANWMGGTLNLHLNEFPRYFGNTPIRDIGLLATEGRISIPVEDHTATGVLDAGGAFYEFIPEQQPNSVLRCHELKTGETYKVLLTNSAGLYRYDIGDFVRVTGFLGEAPMIEFLHRGAHVASMTGEKLTEWQATRAFSAACRQLDCRTTQFVLAPAWDSPPFYRLYVDEAVPQRLAESVDEHLSQMNMEYGSKRSSNRLGGVSLAVLPRGTIGRKNSERQARRGIGNEQYKQQYLLTKPGDDDDLCELVTVGQTVRS